MPRTSAAPIPTAEAESFVVESDSNVPEDDQQPGSTATGRRAKNSNDAVKEAFRQCLMKHEERKDHFVCWFPSDNKVTIVEYDSIWSTNRAKNYGKCEPYPRMAAYISRGTKPYSYDQQYLKAGDKLTCSYIGEDGKEVSSLEKKGNRTISVIKKWTAEIVQISSSIEIAQQAATLKKKEAQLEKMRKDMLSQGKQANVASGPLKTIQSAAETSKSKPPAPPLDTEDFDEDDQDAAKNNNANNEAVVRKKRDLPRGFVSIEVRDRKNARTAYDAEGKKGRSQTTYQQLVETGNIDAFEYLRCFSEMDVNRRDRELKEPTFKSEGHHLYTKLFDRDGMWYFQEVDEDHKYQIVQGLPYFFDYGVGQLIANYEAGKLTQPKLIWYIFIHAVGGEAGICRLSSLYEMERLELQNSVKYTPGMRLRNFVKDALGEDFMNAFRVYLEQGVFKRALNRSSSAEENDSNATAESSKPAIACPYTYNRFLNEKLTSWRTWEKAYYLRERHLKAAVAGTAQEPKVEDPSGEGDQDEMDLDGTGDSLIDSNESQESE